MNAINTRKKSPIHENADAIIPAILVTLTSAVLGVRCHTLGHTVCSIIVIFYSVVFMIAHTRNYFYDSTLKEIIFETLKPQLHFSLHPNVACEIFFQIIP